MPEPESIIQSTPKSEGLWSILKRLGPAAVLGVVAAVMPVLGSIALYYAMARTNLGPWLKSHGYEGVALYSAAFIVLAGMALLPTYAQSALGGYAFRHLHSAPPHSMDVRASA